MPLWGGADLLAEWRAGEGAPQAKKGCKAAFLTMAGGFFNHNLIAPNILSATCRAAQEKPCFVFGSNMRLEIEELKRYTYADVMVLCGEPQFMLGRNDTITNPLVMIEVLSPTTIQYNQQGKFRLYKNLPSLEVAGAFTRP